MSKGSDTRQAILEEAIAVSSRVGLDGLSIGQLAQEVGLSKSGLFAHFGSKEGLQRKVLEAGAEKFIDAVVRPALTAPRGAPRLQALFDGWIRWPERNDLPGGCPFVAASHELDDQPGPVRELLVQYQQDWLATITRAAEIAVEEGHLRSDLDSRLFAYEFQSIILGYHYYLRLMRDEGAMAMAERSFSDLLGRSRAQR